MKVKIVHPLVFYLMIISVFLSVWFEGPITPCDGHGSNDLLINRSSFPANFLFGAGSSAYQNEGAANIDGRKPGIWDTFTKNHPESIMDHSNGDVADEFYFRYKEDIALMKEIGLDSFRFSISWSRVLPQGKVSGGVNQQGVDFYNNLINELILNGIEPLVTIFHFDVPQTLEDQYGGFLSPKIMKDYVDYADFCFKEFGDRVKYWITINEPEMFSILGYAIGRLAPGRCSDYIGNCFGGNSATEPYVVTHHLILCHATAVKLYRENYQASQKGFIGISIFTFWPEPKFKTKASKKAASRALDFHFGWIFEPITYGNYPKTMQYLVGDRLPNFTRPQSEMIKGSIDFLGLNYYTAYYADELTSSYNSTNLSYLTDVRVNITMEKNGIPIGEPTDVRAIYIYPKGLRELLQRIKKKYNSPSVYITENGMPDVNYTINDSLRIKYHHLHLSYLLEAIRDEVDVRGYYAWSFLDSFEWFSGYTTRYGLIYVDRQNGLKRYPKKSGLWFKNFLQKRKSYTDQ